MAGNVEVIKALEAAGCNFYIRYGHIGLSKKHNNSIQSNILGACAYWGNHEALEYCLKKFSTRLKDFIDVETWENCWDFMESMKTGKIYTPEANNYTPIQLSLVGPKPNSEVIRLLFKFRAKLTVIDYQTIDNIMHLACRSNNN